MSLADLFGIATGAAGACEMREGIDVLKMLRGESAPRQHLIGMVEVPGSHDFKIMVLTDEWKYIFMANGGREQLFNRKRDPNELSNRVTSSSESSSRASRATCSTSSLPIAIPYHPPKNDGPPGGGP